MRKEILISVVLCLTLALMEIFFVHPHKVHFFWQKIPAFFLLLGIIGSITLMFFSKFLGKVFLSRKPNYYKETE